MKDKKFLGPYEIRDKIGQGGMGVVYRAYERNLDREVAIKVLPREVSSNEKYIDRFLRESKAAAKIEHPNIVTIYGAGVDEGDYYLAMQLVKGKTLAKIVREEGVLPWKEALEVIRQAASALHVAHQKGIIHRDIKPDNIMIEQSGIVKVMDFGLAKGAVFDSKITESGVYLGTPEYSSPEQCETLEVDARADIYSLGVVLYEMLSGTVPHKAETPLSLFKKIVYDKPRPIDEINPLVPKTVVSLLEKMLAKKREHRYQDAGEVVGDIDKILGKSRETSLDKLLVDGVPTSEISLKPPAEAKSRARIAVAAFAAAFAAAALAVTLVLTGLSGREADDSGAAPDGSGTAPSDGAGLVRLDPAASETQKKEKPAVCVVLDFENLQGNADLAWMKVGVADMIITDLARISWLNVYSREKIQEKLAAFRAGGASHADAVNKVVEDLKADILVRGSYVLIGGKVKIDIKVVGCPGGQVVLSDGDMGTEDELLDVVDRLSRKIRANLELKYGKSMDRIAGEVGAPGVSPVAEHTLVNNLISLDPPEGVTVEFKDLPTPGEMAEIMKLLSERLDVVAGYMKGKEGAKAVAALRDNIKNLEQRRRSETFRNEEDAEEAKDEPGREKEKPAATPAAPSAEGAGGSPKKDKASDAGEKVGKDQAEDKKSTAASDAEPERCAKMADAEKEVKDGSVGDAGTAPGSKEGENLTRGRMSRKLGAAGRPAQLMIVTKESAQNVLKASKLAYKAQIIIEGDAKDAESLAAAAGMLNEALSLEPNLLAARNMLKQVAKIVVVIQEQEAKKAETK